MGSSGLHSNGYSLARHVLLEIARMPLEGHVEEFGHTLGEELLDPDPHLRQGLPGAGRRDRRAHVRAHHRRRPGPQPGAGAARRACGAVVDRGTLDARAGVLADRRSAAASSGAEMEKTFNMGVGMVAVLPADDVDRALAVLTARHVPAWVLGEVDAGSVTTGRGARAELVGNHPRF